MFTKIVSLSLVLLMLNFVAVPTAFAGDKKKKREAKIAKRAVEVEKGVRELGVGKESKVKVKMWDKSKVKGYVSDIAADGFTVTDKKGAEHFVEFTKAKQIKGNNLHAGVWVAIGIGAALIVFLAIFQQFDS